MRKLFLVVLCVLALAVAATAQGKIESKWGCPKSSENPTLEIGDAPGHSYALAKGTCNATSGASGEKSGAYTEVQELWKNSFKIHGYFNVTLSDGDMVFYTYESSVTDMTKPIAETWKIVGGTGKHKGIQGKGTCTGNLKDDGSSDWVCSGTSSLGAKPAGAKPKA